MKRINFYLVLEKRLGDYNLVNINELDICNSEVDVSNDIGSIDLFTSNYNEEEIKASIERSNVVENSYLGGNLKLVSDVKHNLKVLTKDVFVRILDFQSNTEEMDQDFKNKLYGIYKRVIEQVFKEDDVIKRLLERFKECLKSNNKEYLFKIIEELPYVNSRKIYFTIYECLNKRKNVKSRKLEKLDEVA